MMRKVRSVVGLLPRHVAVIVPAPGVKQVMHAQAAARALLENTELSAREIAEKALDIAGDICIYTNHFHTIEELSYKA